MIVGYFSPVFIRHEADLGEASLFLVGSFIEYGSIWVNSNQLRYVAPSVGPSVRW